MNESLVSVIIPTFNRAPVIKRSVMSVLNQTYSNIEVIIVDDGSTDNTEEIIKTINDSRVFYVKQSNKGACAARNYGINLANGVYIAFQDSDDVWHKNKLRSQIDRLVKNEADLVFCKMAINGDMNKTIPKNFYEGFIPPTRLPLGGSTQTICGVSKIFKEEKFNEVMPRLQDFELLLRIQKKYRIYFMDNTLIDYYIQDDSISHDYNKLIKAWEIILKKYEGIKQNHKQELNEAASVILSLSATEKNKLTKKGMMKLAMQLGSSVRIKLQYLANKTKLIYLYRLLFNGFTNK